MKRTSFLLEIIALSQFTLTAQIAGNTVFGNPRAQSAGLATGDLFAVEPKGSVPISFIDLKINYR